MSGTLKSTHLNTVREGNLEVISDFFCGSGHVVPKHVNNVIYEIHPHNP